VRRRERGRESAEGEIDEETTHHSVLTVQRKNCEPLVLGPALAIERMPGPVCLWMKFSSANLAP
jgi:hypothetical protein